MPGLALADLAQRIQTTGNQKLTILWTEIYRKNGKINLTSIPRYYRFEKLNY